jgi:hypothetical protein
MLRGIGTYGQSSLELFDPWICDPIGSPETSVAKYQRTLLNIPEEWRRPPDRGGSLKSHMDFRFASKIVLF